jgi:putative transposase
MSRRKEPAIPNELLDQLLSGGAASAAFEQGGLLDSLKKALAERALNAEMDHHLAGDDGAGNTRNGYGRKTVVTDTGKLAIDVPRDRQSSFDPQLIAKYQRRFPGFDDKIVSMYARGMSTREITAHLQELYGIDVSPDLISTVTDAVLDEVATWQQRPLDPIYRWSSSMPSGSRSATRGWFVTRRSTLRWACAPMVPRKCSAYGLSRMKAPSSGYGS